MYCKNCGKEINDEAVICDSCGVDTKENNSISNENKKSFIVTLLLCLFLGTFGAHRFYTGHTGTALAQLILSLSVFGIMVSMPWALIDFIMILTGTFKTAKGEALSKTISHKEELKKSGIILQTELKHVNGLPIPENTLCKINVFENKYEFIANGLNFNLENSKITDISIKTDVEISKQAVSSIGGAIAGSFLFGPLGAIIGGRAKTKNVKTVTKYLIITYLSNEEVKYIGFEAGGFEASGAFRIQTDFAMRNLTKPVQTQTIDL